MEGNQQVTFQVLKVVPTVVKSIFEVLRDIREDILAPSKRSKAAKAAAERSRERIEEIIQLVRKRKLSGKEYRQLLNRLAELQEYIRRQLYVEHVLVN